MSNWKKRTNCESKGDTKNIISSLLESRGLDESIMSEGLDSLSNPLLLGNGASVAADILIGCRGKQTAVIGDYDADGVMSSAIMHRTIEMIGGKCSVFLPSRWKHGYGLNNATVSDFQKTFFGKMPDVLFVLDCGSSSESHIVNLKKAGVKQIVVIDHHIINKNEMTQSADAHINWRQSGSLKNLCAAGEVFLVAKLALTRLGMDWEWALPMAAIATVGDSVPVTGDNRIIVKYGAEMNRLVSSGSPGLCSLATTRCSGGVSQKNLSFYVVPRINAAGRVSVADIALEFILEQDSFRSAQLTSSIETFNNERKVIQENILRQGISMIGGQHAKPSYVFLHNPDWSIGVCGISCSQMVEKYGVPTMMFGT